MSDAGPGTAQAADEARRLLAAVDSAWHAGDAAALRRDLTARLRRRPADQPARLALATLDRLAYRDSAASDGYAALLDVPAAATDALGARAALGRGLLHAQAWRTVEADQWLEQAAVRADRHHLPDVAAEALLALAALRARTKGVAHALALADTAAARLGTDTGRVRGLLHCTRAALLARAGQAGAQALADSGRALAHAAADLRLEAACLSARAQDYERAGFTRLAIPLLEEAATLQRRTGHHGGLAASQQWLGYLYMSGGNYGAALRSYDEAVREAVASGNRSALAWSHLGLAELALRLDDLQTAERQVAAARVVLDDVGDFWGLARAHSLVGDLALVSGSTDSARESYMAALEVNAQRNPAFVLLLRRSLARVEARSGRTDLAAAHLLAVDSLSVAHRQRGWEVERDFDYGLLALDSGLPDSAVTRFRAFLARTHETQHERRFDGRVRLAHALALSGSSMAAAHELRSAMDELHQWRQGAADRVLRTTAFHRRRLDMDPDAGVAGVIDALVTSGHTVEALNLLERHRGRDLLDRMALRHALAHSPVAADEGSSQLPAAADVDIAAVRSALPAGTALVAYHAPRSAAFSYAFVVRDDGVSAVRLPAADSMAHMIERFSLLLQTGAEAHGIANELARLVMRPVLDLLAAGTERIAVVPDGVYSRLPFDALLLDDTFLIERFELSIAPSAAYALRTWTMPAVHGSGGMVVFADPAITRTQNGPEGDAFDRVFGASPGPPPVTPPLPAARREARRVARYGTPARVLVRGQANEAALRSMSMEPLGVIHFATHAVVEERSLLRTALVLAPGGGSDGLVRPDALAAMNLSADVVVLSGCRTAGGPALAVEGIQGLAVPLLGSGARSVVATQWEVRDGSMIALLDDFYAAMAQGSAAGPALRHARLAALRRGEPINVWAAPVLIGDPGAMPLLAMPPAYGQARTFGAATLAVLLAGALLLAWRRALHR